MDSETVRRAFRRVLGMETSGSPPKWRAQECPNQWIRREAALEEGRATFSTWQRKEPEKPVVLLDLDGVINTQWDRDFVSCHWQVRNQWPDACTFLQDVDSIGGPVTLRYSPSVIARLKQWHDQKLCNFMWHTSWKEKAQTSVAPNVQPPLPHFPIAPFEKSETAGELQKDIKVRWRAATPIVWIDDRVGSEGTIVHDFMVDRPRTLVVAPATHEGLSPQQLDEIEQFLSHPSYPLIWGKIEGWPTRKSTGEWESYSLTLSEWERAKVKQEFRCRVCTNTGVGNRFFQSEAVVCGDRFDTKQKLAEHRQTAHPSAHEFAESLKGRRSIGCNLPSSYG
uniref:Uncharacterized protein n=1 Tax=Chromera velia CCMP2878 TaxID=1169474 RepID=A0A0G4HEI7_9ALVE|eukprot:Cvel_26629.t1-p1 / transcript=Cvel_26629.t1 / gene=Cvel_26629 / organism=Chromera_velia_CCMP2878 / gene_product=hypothetical protein / transcript_product=hypothetical protein / location=Cvel_scaffold3199:8058-9065(-) / protein_length=336 / sequence_SO=supercontig / SO=protein_coding / is_pseudo=false